jgi:16S rRNA (guanine(527)-N(7))-methyltransferase RsmG
LSIDNLQSETSMHPARIAELLDPFLRSASTPVLDHPERGLFPGDVIPNGPNGPVRNLLSTKQLEYISMYIDILLRWNSHINLTAIRDPEEIVTRHFGESLFAARHLFPRTTHLGRNTEGQIAHVEAAAEACPEQAQRVEWGCPAERSSAAKPTEGQIAHVGTAAPGCPAERSSAVTDENAGGVRGRAALQRRGTDREETGALAPEANERAHNAAVGASRGIEPATDRIITIADIGSGAGFPGIPIKLWAPDICLTLIESNQKKATFLREIARSLTLTDVNVQNVRAESLAGPAFDVVTLRAVERFQSILPVAASLVASGGRLALLIGSSQLAEAQSAVPQLDWLKPEPIPGSSSRILAVARARD